MNHITYQNRKCTIYVPNHSYKTSFINKAEQYTVGNSELCEATYCSTELRMTTTDNLCIREILNLQAGSESHHTSK